MKTLLLIATSLLCPGVCRRHPHRLHLRLLRRRMGAGPQDQKQAFEKECGCTLNLVAPRGWRRHPQPAAAGRPAQQGRPGAGLDDALISEAKQAACSPPFHQARWPQGAGWLAG